MVALADVLRPSNDRVTLAPETRYKQVTARLWGKGLALRGEVTGAEIAASQQNRVRTGQFVVSKIDARHGAFGVVLPELDGAVVSNDFPVFDVRSDVAVTAYIAWVSRTDWFIALCNRASEGSTNRVRLKEVRFLAQCIPLPTLTEQYRIVARLDAAAAAMAARITATGELEAELAATLAAAFDRITRDAPRSTMGEIAPLVRRPVTIDPDATYLELGVRSFGRGLFAKPDVAGDAVTWQSLFRIEAGDLVFSNIKAWEGAFAVAEAEHAGKHGSHRYLTCVPDTGRATPGYLWFYLQSEEGLRRINEASPGSADRNRTLATKRLAAITVPVPPLDAQHWFDRLQAKVRAARVAQTAATAELDALLPALLHDAFGDADARN
jgi:type I restriction enzyme S subunit